MQGSEGHQVGEIHIDLGVLQIRNLGDQGCAQLECGTTGRGQVSVLPADASKTMKRTEFENQSIQSSSNAPEAPP